MGAAALPPRPASAPLAREGGITSGGVLASEGGITSGHLGAAARLGGGTRRALAPALTLTLTPALTLTLTPAFTVSP